MKRFQFWLAIVVVGSAASSTFAQRGEYTDLQSEPLFQSYFESSNRIGNERSMIQGDLFLTTLQTDRSLLFVDVRTNWVDPDKYEGNFGLGWRGITDAGYILGSYVYYDRMKSAAGNYFSQATVGVEMMTLDWDFRVNGYFPQTGGEILGQTTALFNGQTFVIETPTEYAYIGTDLEVGRLLACTDDGNVELRAFATGYYFDRDKAAYEEIIGGRGRLEMRMYDLDWLGPNSRVMVGAQYQYDDYRGNIASGLVSVRIPFGSGCRQPDRLQRRITDSIIRDNDIVTRIGTLRETGINPETGNPFGVVTVIDANTNAVAAVAAARANSLIVADGSHGDVEVAAPLILKDGQTVRSAGFNVMGASSRRQARFGSPGAIVGTNPTQNVIVLANDVELRELTVRGGLNNVVGTDATGLYIHDSEFLAASQFGFLMSGTNVGEYFDNVIQRGASLGEFRGTLARNVVTANSTFGVRFDSLNGNILNNTVTGNTNTAVDIGSMAAGRFTDNQLNGTFATGVSVASMPGGEISNNQVQGATQDAFSIASLNGGAIRNNTARNSGRHGFNISSFTRGTVTGNTAISNGGSGFEFGTVSTNIVDGDIVGNRSTFNNVGFHFDSITGSPSIDQNFASNNTSDGFLFTTASDGLWFDGNTSNSNGGNGFNLGNLPGGFLTNNVGNSNGGAGMLIGTINNGFVTDSSFANNGGGGLVIGDMNVGNVSNNTLSNNTGAGLTIGFINNGSINMNIANGNTTHGFSIADFDFGSMDGNTADNNGAHGFDFTRFGSGDLANSMASNNAVDGFHISTFDSSILSEITSNVAEANGNDGFDIGSIGGWTGAGQLNDNTATNNVNFGYNIQGRVGGSAAGNTASGNGDDTLPAP